MLRFKLFVGDGKALEDNVNSWLTEFEPDIQQMAQSRDGDSICLMFLFEESFRGQERRLSIEHGMADADMPAIPPGAMPDKPLVMQEPPVPPADPGR